MNLIYFIRLLLRHYLILMLGPVILFAIIFYQTKDTPKVYTTKTTVYTGIASGSSLTSIESTKVDRLTTMTAFDNLINVIKSRGTAEEVGLRLFTAHMLLEKPDPERISKESFDKLKRIVPEEVKKLVVKGDYDKTYNAFLKYKNKDFENFIYELIYLNHPDYSYEKILAKLKVKRIYSSDIIELSYTSNDPGICQQTLEIVNEVFIEKYSSMKLIQSDAILKYFEKQLAEAQAKLDEAEDQLLVFNKQNNIINYYEQSEQIAIQKEQFATYYNELKMENRAASAVLMVLENKLTAQQKKELNNSDIIKLRNEIAQLNINISVKGYEAEFDSINKSRLMDEIAEMNIESYNLQQKLRESINQAYFIDNSIEGVTSSNVLDQWLENVIVFESTRAKLLVGDEKIQDFEELMKEYAPKGATMKRLERKINIAEQEYLSILHSLNVAKLKQQNLEFNANLKVSEPPVFPLKSQPSKRKILLLIGLIIGFIIPAFIIIAFDFLNQNIRTVARIEDLAQASVAAAYPNMIKKSRRKDYAELGRLSLNKLFQSILNMSGDLENKGPLKIIIFSIQDGEGKTTLGVQLAERLASSNFKSVYLNYDESGKKYDFDYIKYNVGNEFVSCNSLAGLATDIDIEDYQFAIIEIPSVGLNNYPVKLFREADMVLLTVRANRSWNDADKNALQKLSGLTQNVKQAVLLNGVELNEMEKVIGEIPGKRSFIRRVFKQVISFQFYSKKTIG